MKICKKKSVLAILTILIILCFLLYLRIREENNKYSKDMKYFINTVEENYPYQEYLNFDEKKDFYLEAAQSCESLEEFYKLLKSIVKPYNGLGHLFILNAEEYYLHQVTYDMALEDRLISLENDNYKILNDNEVKATYDQLSSLTGTTLDKVKQSMYENQNGENKENVHFQKYDDVLVIKIDSFDYSLIENDMKIIKEYLATYDGDCIAFDIRENSGGADSYWINLVAMTSDQDYEYNKKVTGRGEISLSYAKEEIEDAILHQSKDDFEIQVEKKIESQNIYNFPKRYILTSSKNLSSADTFVKFAKESNYAVSVGEHTKGSGGDFLNPMLLELPNTHIIFRMDACKTDEIGSKPDIAVTGDALQFFLNMEK
ncbi:peptidase S41 family [Amedibacillus dolichus CAG:375]|uniref:Peptidase S41 family n=2 Tax=Amedibacillus dolichus TaxID=31971 RepID=R7GCM3_9FIRM|nr:S41 family peptidase [Amedibacillus dolichus]CDE23687.1 peptidase S41 family [Amedibacillus dolichus CAG:375]